MTTCLHCFLLNKECLQHPTTIPLQVMCSHHTAMWALQLKLSIIRNNQPTETGNLPFSSSVVATTITCSCHSGPGREWVKMAPSHTPNIEIHDHCHGRKVQVGHVTRSCQPPLLPLRVTCLPQWEMISIATLLVPDNFVCGTQPFWEPSHHRPRIHP